jgi:hypothetical protein
MNTTSTYLHALRRPGAVWLMLCVLVFSVLAPTASMALVSNTASGPAGYEVCTPSGPTWIAADPDQSAPETPDGRDSGKASPHCPFCLQPTDRGVAPPPHQPYLFLVQGGNQERPVWQAFFFLARVAIVAPPPRGPPSSSL